MTHDLKTWSEYFEPVVRGEKTAELRHDDRGFAVGDLLILREYDPMLDEYSGRIVSAYVSHVLRGGPWLSEGYAMLSLMAVKAGYDTANT